MNYKKMLLLVSVLVLASAILAACGAPPPEIISNNRTDEGSAVTLLPDYYLGYDQQYAAVFLNDPLTGKRCLVVYNNGGGSAVNGAAPSSFCYDQ